MLVSDEAHVKRGRAAGFAENETIILSDTPADQSLDGGRSGPGPDELSFLISTSGTTGRPKLVMQSHRNVLHNAVRTTSALGIVPEDRIAWLAPLGSSHGLSGVWGALINGATLCPFRVADQGLIGLREWLLAEGVTLLDTSPSVLRNLCRTLGNERIPGVRLVRLTAEPVLRVDFDCFRRHFPHDCVLASTLGSSETGLTLARIFRHEDEPSGESLSVGAEPDDIRLLLLDQGGHDLAESQVGEIVVQSRYLSAGYWRDDERTAEHFEGEGEMRRFRTGDLGQRLPSGDLAVLGRLDSQVQIRGQRLQLEEVEGALAAQPGVTGAAAALRLSSRGDPTLTAYVMVTSGSTLDAGRLRRSLAAMLPAYAVPTSWVHVDALPLTPNGKIDRVRLVELALVREVSASAQLDRPASGVERALLSIWEELLDHRPIGLANDFFSIGGDSLGAMEMLAAIEERLGWSLTPSALIEAPTIEGLAAVIRGDSRPLTGVVPRPGLADSARPPLFLVPGLGQSGLRFRRLADALGPDFPLRALEVPWWDGRPSKIRTVEQLATFFAQQIRELQAGGPYLIGGSSFGGRVALEVARQLATASHEIALLVVFDTYVGINAEWNGALARRLAARARWRLRQRGFGSVRPGHRAAYVGHRTVGLIRTARPSPYEGRVILFRCIGTRWPAADRGWGAVALGGLEVHDLACKHDEQFDPPFVQQLADGLAEVLNATYSKDGVSRRELDRSRSG